MSIVFGGRLADFLLRVVLYDSYGVACLQLIPPLPLGKAVFCWLI